MFKYRLILTLCVLVFGGCSSPKPPPQCQGEMRALNGIQLEAKDIAAVKCRVPEKATV